MLQKYDSEDGLRAQFRVALVPLPLRLDALDHRAQTSPRCFSARVELRDGTKHLLLQVAVMTYSDSNSGKCNNLLGYSKLDPMSKRRFDWA
ncbi:hypothetical protein GQ600_11330 [Phytophthora cactorum]|nr:hypothetical protein GQ600_11330 [Phytophthora cactorum]